MGRTRRGVLAAAGAVLVAGAGFGVVRARRDLGEARAAVATSPTAMIDTRHGPMQVAERGAGPPVLMLHGTGGGFDQGLLFAAPLVARGFRVIAPSRFGYLGTPLPEGADAAMEAEALADLLDALKLERVAVAGGSAGAIPALALAARYPERVAALFPIVPALVIPDRPAVDPWPVWMEKAVFAALGSDALFWTATRLARDQVIGTVLATDPALVRAATAAEQARVAAIVETLLPVAPRVQGTLYDNRQTNRWQGLDLAAISAPTLTLACEDDRFLTDDNARWLAEQIAGAELRIFPDGGHVWVGRDDALFDAVEEVLRRVFPG